MSYLGDLIYKPGKIEGEAAGKKETHSPKIKVPKTVKAGEPFTVEIEVGPHPNQAVHSIRYIQLFFKEDNRAFNPIHLATAILEPEYADPKIVFTIRVKRSGTLYALGYCNLHGLWEFSVDIKVE
ncbi:MAG: class II SORL domain-containing protein [Desulfurococcales archaeon]|nr:class II SORL domain-containing protein [Desulfurococcales archaeon]